MGAHAGLRLGPGVVGLQPHRRIGLGPGVGRDAFLDAVGRAARPPHLDPCRCGPRRRGSRSAAPWRRGTGAGAGVLDEGRAARRWRRGSRRGPRSDVLGCGDLDVVDVVARFQIGSKIVVGEPQREQVLDRFLAEGVVDARDLRSSKSPRTRRFARASVSVVPNGFSITIRTAASGRACRPCSPRRSTMAGKNPGAVAS